MNTRNYLWKLLILVVFVIISCTKNPAGANKVNSLEMYFLEDATLSYPDIMHTPVNNLQLAEQPFFTHEDIKSFTVLSFEDATYDKYMFTFRDSITNRENETRPFVMVLNQERLFSGEYWGSMMDSYPQGILIIVLTPQEFTLHPINKAGYDKMKIERIITTLERLDVEIKHE
ncbi:MAG TPA: hypothetical protein PLP19_19265 [bacterium]|nr:hypothetical protein [bacterium]HPN45636.1 hypothetical protein [bacterium]